MVEHVYFREDHLLELARSNALDVVERIDSRCGEPLVERVDEGLRRVCRYEIKTALLRIPQPRCSHPKVYSVAQAVVDEGDEFAGDGNIRCLERAA